MKIFVVPVYVNAEDWSAAKRSLDARVGVVTEDPSIPMHDMWYDPTEIATADPSVGAGMNLYDDTDLTLWNESKKANS